MSTWRKGDGHFTFEELQYLCAYVFFFDIFSSGLPDVGPLPATITATEIIVYILKVDMLHFCWGSSLGNLNVVQPWRHDVKTAIGHVEHADSG